MTRAHAPPIATPKPRPWTIGQGGSIASDSLTSMPAIIQMNPARRTMRDAGRLRSLCSLDWAQCVISLHSGAGIGGVEYYISPSCKPPDPPAITPDKVRKIPGHYPRLRAGATEAFC